MSKKVKVIVLRTAGTNCDEETAFAFRQFEADAQLVHINELLEGQKRLSDYHILAIPGGFTYGDDIESGRILANELNNKLGSQICHFLGEKKLIIGICNGFQVLVKSGILPGPLNQEEARQHDSSQKTTLFNNDSGKFEDRWTYLKTGGRCVWTEGLKDVVYFPVAHAEGKFITQNKKILEQLKKNKQIIFSYCTEHGKPPRYPQNPNGSFEHIAGVTDKSGRVLGLMPHPERHFLFTQHPRWTRMKKNGVYGDGAKIFENGVKYVRRNF